MKQGTLLEGRFLVDRVAGTGGMGRVYRAIDRTTDREVAIKVALDVGSVDLERFDREVALLSGLAHDAIVRFVARGRTPDGDAYLVMDWIDGEPLSSRLDRGPLDVTETLALGTRVADALGAAHALGVVHRDVKPANVVLAAGDVRRAILIDFGVARHERRGSSITGSGTLLGTVGYMAPEQARGQRGLDARADVFSLGALLFRCLTGQPLYEGTNPLAILLKVVLEEPRRPRDVVSGIPLALDALVARMLSKDPSARPADGAAVAAELRAIQEDVGSTTRALADEAPRPSHGRATLTAGERRIVCLVLTREEEGALSQRQALDRAAAAEGSRVERLADGSLLAVFSGLGSAQEQAARAVRAALAMRQVARPSALCVVTGRGELDGGVPVGDAIERGAPLLREAAAQAGAVVTDPVTAGLVSGLFDVHSEGALFVVRGGTKRGRRAVPCIGRDREAAMLDATLDECVNLDSARAVLLTGAPGVGKSRVAAEFMRRAILRGDVTVRQVAGAPVGAGSAFALLARLVRVVLDLSHAGALREALASRVPADDLERLTTSLGELIERSSASASGGVPDSRRDGVVVGDQIRFASEDLLRAEATRRPLLIVLEDLHWGDLSTVSFLGRALKNLRDVPWMLLGVARPSADDLFPRVWDLAPDACLHLGPLAAEASLRIVDLRVGSSVDAVLRARIVDLAAGNPFLLEELTRTVSKGQHAALPATAVAMAQARLEAEPPASRRVLRAASAFGQTFWRDGLRSMLDAEEDVDGALAKLVDHEVIERRARSRFEGTEELAFRHALHRDAAYAMLTHEDRALAHVLAGEWLESKGERDALVLAEHFELGGERAKAAEWYRRASSQAIEGNDFKAAVDFARRGIAMGGEGGSLADLYLCEAEAHRWAGDFPMAARAAEAAIPLLEPGSAPWFTAASEACVAASRRGEAARRRELSLEILRLDPGGAPTVAQRDGPGGAFLLALSRAAIDAYLAVDHELGDALFERARVDLEWANEALPVAASRIFVADGLRGAATWNPPRMYDLYARASAASERAGDLRTVVVAQSNAASLLAELGAYGQAIEVLERALPRARQMGLANAAAFIAANLGYALSRSGRLDDAAAHGRWAVAELRGKDARMSAGAHLYLSATLEERGEMPEAESEARLALAGTAIGHSLRGMALARLASVLVATGRASEAEPYLAEARALVDGRGGFGEGESIFHLVCAQAAWALDRRDDARALIGAARDRVVRLAGQLDPRWGRSFLENVPENRRTLELAEAWLTAPAV